MNWPDSDVVSEAVLKSIETRLLCEESLRDAKRALAEIQKECILCDVELNHARALTRKSVSPHRPLSQSN